MKKINCKDCKKSKSSNEFYWRKKSADLKQACCKVCSNKRDRKRWKTTKKNPKKKEAAYEAVRQYQRKHVKELQIKVYHYQLTHPCVDCGETNPIVLDFDHVRGKKKANICSLMSRGSKWETLEKEIAKCDVRCANCHRIRTAYDQQWAKYIYHNTIQVNK